MNGMAASECNVYIYIFLTIQMPNTLQKYLFKITVPTIPVLKGVACIKSY